MKKGKHSESGVVRSALSFPTLLEKRRKKGAGRPPTYLVGCVSPRRTAGEADGELLWSSPVVVTGGKEGGKKVADVLRLSPHSGGES